MEKHFVVWKETKCPDGRGSEVHLPMAALIDVDSRGTLLSQILRMPGKKPILFDEAIRMVRSKLNEAFDLGDAAQYNWLILNFVQWISSNGFHIELTGDEFEAAVIPERLS